MLTGCTRTETAITMTVNQESLTFTATVGESNPPAQSVNVQGSHGEEIHYSIEINYQNPEGMYVDTPWLSASRNSLGFLEVSADNQASLAANTYSATITISANQTSPEVINSPQTLSVTFIKNQASMVSCHTTWSADWYTITDLIKWDTSIGNSEFPSTFDYNWGNGVVYGGYSGDIGFEAYAVINMQRTSGGPVTFTIGCEDGATLELDGIRIVDELQTGAYRTRSYTTYVSHGQHRLRLYYYVKDPPAHISFNCDSDVLEWEVGGNAEPNCFYISNRP